MKRTPAIHRRQLFLFFSVSKFYQPFPKRQILDYSKQREFADNNFKLDKTGRRFFKLAEKTGKKRNCSLRAISPFPTVFSEACTANTVKPGLVWERVKDQTRHIAKGSILQETMTFFYKIWIDLIIDCTYTAFNSLPHNSNFLQPSRKRPF